MAPEKLGLLDKILPKILIKRAVQPGTIQMQRGRSFLTENKKEVQLIDFNSMMSRFLPRPKNYAELKN